MAEQGYIEIDGWREFRSATRKAADSGLPKRLGQANKETGEFVKKLVERESSPQSVGAGRGADVRPSAAKREVMWRVGGSFREHPDPEVTDMRQWGKNVVRPFERLSKRRPYMKQIAEDHRDEIGDFFLEAVSRAMDPAFYNTEP